MQHHLQDDTMQSIIRRKNEWLTTSQQIVGEYFGATVDAYKEENLVALELAKGVTRAFLRYDPEVFSLGKSVYEQLKLQSGNINAISYSTLPYAIIHWPSDLSEKGPMHKDGYYYIRNFHTTWTPLNDCRHEAIAVVENSHHTPSLLARKLHLRQPDSRVVKPLINCGEFLTWYGNTDHEGLLNTSSEPTVAIVFRFTSTPILLEATIESSRLGPMETRSELNIISFSTRLLEIYEEAARLNYEKQLPERIDQLCEKVAADVASWKMTSTDRHKMASALTLLAQRMEGRQPVPAFYLYAAALSSHMVYPVQQLTNYLLNATTASNAGYWMRWVMARYPYLQHAHVLNERMAEWNRKKAYVYADTGIAKDLLYWNESI